MISINVTFLIQMVNFLVFLVLMNFVLYRPIRSILAQRRQIMEDRQAAIDEMNAQVDEAVREFDLKIQDARQTGRNRLQDMKAAAHEQEKDLLQEAADEASRKLQDIRASIREEVGTARDQLKGQVQAFSRELAQRILGRSV